MDMIEKKLEEFLNQNKVKLDYKVSFPIYNIIPDEVKLALSVLGKHGMKISIMLKPVEEEKKE